MAFSLKITAPPLLTSNSSNSSNFFTPIPTPLAQKLFYTPTPDYTFDRRISFLPSFKDTASRKKKLKTAKLKRCEALARITLILQKYQKWVRKTKCILPKKWDFDSDSDDYSDTDSDDTDSDDSDDDSDDDLDDMTDDEKMNLALYQQLAYGNNSMILKIKKNKVYNWINRGLGKNYSENRLLEDYMHLLNEHKSEFEEIHNHICNALDGQIKPHDNFQEIYYTYSQSHSGLHNIKIDIKIEKLLDEIQLHFGGIFDSIFYHQKYEIIQLIGTGIEGNVHKIKLRNQFNINYDDVILQDINENKDDINPVGSLLLQASSVSNSSSSSSSSNSISCSTNSINDYYYAAKTISYNERTMNNYQIMSKLNILDDFEMYLDKKNDKLILVCQLWDSDLYDYMKNNSKIFNEIELHRIMTVYIIPLLAKLHDNNYIHGDIKPSNFVININNNNLHDYGLIDFGTMLKLNDLSQTIRSSLIGSSGYYSPELVFSMFDGAILIDTKIDIYALGLTLIYLLTGNQPFLNGSDIAILGEKKIKIIINKCLKKMKNISQNLSNLLLNMLDVNPLNRFNLYQIRNHEWITQKKCELKLLFLDIDGVLNTSKSSPKTIKPELLIKLKKIINLTQCKMVLSSSWRRVPNLKKKFRKEFNKIIRLNYNDIYYGDTPSNGKNPTRVHELKEYFTRNNNLNTYSWCVIDDMDLINENKSFKVECETFIKGHWVRTDIKTGLTDQNVNQIIDILNKNIN